MVSVEGLVRGAGTAACPATAGAVVDWPRASRPLPRAVSVASAATFSAEVQWNVVTLKTCVAANDAASEPRNVFARRTTTSAQNGRSVAFARYWMAVRTTDATAALPPIVRAYRHGRFPTATTAPPLRS